jgi:hypothetical protein
MTQILSLTAGPHHVMSEREKGRRYCSVHGWVVAPYPATMVKSSGLGFGVKAALLTNLAAAQLELAFWWRASCGRGHRPMPGALARVLQNRDRLQRGSL